MHLLVVVSHRPPAFSQSAWVVYFVKSLELPDGLAEGELDEPLDAPGEVLVPVPEAGPELAPPDDPEGVLAPELLGVPLPLGVCAAAKAGARARIPTNTASISFCM
jgi:hypothetical protein